MSHTPATTDEREQFISACPEFNYKNTPDGTPEDMRYVFNHKVCLSQVEAYAYALECEKALQAAKTTAIVTGSVGAVHEVVDTDGTSKGRGVYQRPQPRPEGIDWP